ncbi:MAG: flippase [Nitrospirae bacterium]|nr:flippase [Nitrospirota bacterium]
MPINHLEFKKKPEEDSLSVSARGGAIAFALKVVSTALNLLNQVILARFLGAGGIGEVLLALSLVKVSSQIAKFGMEETMMRFIPLYIDQKDSARLNGTIHYAVKFSLLFSIVFILLIMIFSKFISVSIFHSNMLLRLLPVVAIAVPAGAVRDVIAGVFKAYKDTYKALLPENLISPLVRIAIFLLLSLKGVSPLYAAAAFVAGELCAVILSVKYLSHVISPLRHIKGQYDKKQIMDVAASIIFASVILLLYTQADMWILGMFTDTRSVGIYGVASRLVLLIYFPMFAFGTIIPPLMSSAHASGDHHELERITRESSRWILSISMPIILVLILEGRLILRYFFGIEFEAGYSVLVILSAVHLINSATGLSGVFLQMTGQHRLYMKINIFFGIINILLNIIFVSRLGMVGAATATALSIAMLEITGTIIIYRRFSVLAFPKKISFDVFIIIASSILFVLSNLAGIYAGPHIILVSAMSVYIWKSIVNNDIPWRSLVARYKEM